MHARAPPPAASLGRVTPAALRASRAAGRTKAPARADASAKHDPRWHPHDHTIKLGHPTDGWSTESTRGGATEREVNVDAVATTDEATSLVLEAVHMSATREQYMHTDEGAQHGRSAEMKLREKPRLPSPRREHYPALTFERGGARVGGHRKHESRARRHGDHSHDQGGSKREVGHSELAGGKSRPPRQHRRVQTASQPGRTGEDVGQRRRRQRLGNECGSPAAAPAERERHRQGGAAVVDASTHVPVKQRTYCRMASCVSLPVPTTPSFPDPLNFFADLKPRKGMASTSVPLVLADSSPKRRVCHI